MEVQADLEVQVVLEHQMEVVAEEHRQEEEEVEGHPFLVEVGVEEDHPFQVEVGAEEDHPYPAVVVGEEVNQVHREEVHQARQVQEVLEEVHLARQILGSIFLDCTMTQCWDSHCH